MGKVVFNRFDGGIADDYVRCSPGECSISKNFDLLSYPFRLQPIRGMVSANEPSGTALRMMIHAHNGNMYGIGEDPGNPGNWELYKRTGYGGSDGWTDFTTDQLSGSANSEGAGHFDFLVHYPEANNARKLIWASTNKIIFSNPDDSGSADSGFLPFTTIGQGLVHPKDKMLYFPYQTSTATIIGKYNGPAGAGYDGGGNLSNFTDAAFTVATPSRYRIYCLSHYGDLLAVPMTVAGVSAESVVGLWNRDTTVTTFDQTIPWGAGLLKVLNNLNGALIGVSVLSGEISTSGLDIDKIQVKVYEGGAEPYVVKEITATRLTSTRPSCTINHRVNFIHNNRLYFSANVVNGDSDANYYGLWSVGKNKLGQWTVIREQGATNDDSETGVIAAAKHGDFLSCVHSSAGTITSSYADDTLASIYEATSSYETGPNQGIPEDDRHKRKKLKCFFATYLPLPSGGQVTLKYRVNSKKSDSWSTALVESTAGATLTEEVVDSDSSQFPEFDINEIRAESIEGAIITSFGYEYDLVDTQQSE